MRRGIFIVILTAFNFSLAVGQTKMTRQEYIDTYKELAMQEMVETGIPASITLAQGILESGNGNSRLATKANNHFGIKCHDWQGKSISHDDDAKNECFRKYSSVEESYRDHSEFLKTRSRYAFLFELNEDDYKGWAKGLKKAGYATSPTYSKALINIIEGNNLQQYDAYVIANKDHNWKKTEVAQTEYAGNRKVHYNNRVKYVVAKEGDTFESLAEELDLLDWQLPKYNGMNMASTLKEGDYIYLQPKRKKASIENKTHLVKKGESVSFISQQYAMREEDIRKKNGLADHEEPKEGVLLFLRKKNTERVEVVDLLPEIPLKEDPEEQESELEVIIEG
jgi:LysM repeat protein